MECLLDGFLASEVTSQTEVIIEAKADRREITVRKSLCKKLPSWSLLSSRGLLKA
jgi:hypothetical protein